MAFSPKAQLVYIPTMANPGRYADPVDFRYIPGAWNTGERRASLFLLELRQPERSRHPGGPAADNEHVDFKGLALGHYLFSSTIIAGTISNRSPTIP